MKQKPEVSVPKAETVQKAMFRTVFGILYNPAKPRDPNSGAQGRTRDDVPWVIIIPDLSIVAVITDRDGDPVKGHVNPEYAKSFASLLYSHLVSKPELLDSYRKNPDKVEPEDGYMGKMIPIQFKV